MLIETYNRDLPVKQVHLEIDSSVYNHNQKHMSIDFRTDRKGKTCPLTISGSRLEIVTLLLHILRFILNSYFKGFCRHTIGAISLLVIRKSLNYELRRRKKEA